MTAKYRVTVTYTTDVDISDDDIKLFVDGVGNIKISDVFKRLEAYAIEVGKQRVEDLSSVIVPKATAYLLSVPESKS